MRQRSEAAPFRMAVLALIAACTLITSAAMAGLPGFHRRVVCTIPYGDDQGELPVPEPCHGQDLGPEPGLLTFAASDSLLGIFDTCRHLLTTIRLAHGRVASTHTVQGQDLSARKTYIWDGCATADGTVYLAGNGGDRSPKKRK